MNKEYQERFYKEFPAMYQRDNLIDRGFACGDGWYVLLWDLSEDLRDIGLRNNCNVYSVQVKEKFGGLRWYWRIQFAEGVDLTQEEKDFVISQVRDAVRRAEDRSYKTCDVCGQPGKLRVSKTGWYKTVCLADAAEGDVIVKEEEA